jgi:hypothetical protein
MMTCRVDFSFSFSAIPNDSLALMLCGLQYAARSKPGHPLLRDVSIAIIDELKARFERADPRPEFSLRFDDYETDDLTTGLVTAYLLNRNVNGGASVGGFCDGLVTALTEELVSRGVATAPLRGEIEN